MRLVAVASEQGSLDRNKGCAKAPELVLHGKEFETVPIAQNDIEESEERIYLKAREVFAGNETVLFVGGDHSISFALVRAFSESFRNKKALVVFDAHPDCVQFFKPLSHEDWVRGVIEEGFVVAGSVLLVGVRKVHELERRYLKKSGIKVLSAPEVKASFERAMGKLLESIALNEAIYVSIDIDVFDPSVAPGTGYLEGNGLLESEFFPLFEAVLKSGKVRGIDLVEVNPLKDDGKTIELAKEIVDTVGGESGC